MGLYRSARSAEPWHLVRKVFLLLLLVTALALGLVYLLQWGSPAPAIMFNLLADCSIGAVMGFGSRLVLRRRHWLIRAVVAASLSIVGLVLLGFLTDARSGVGPLHLRFQHVNWLDRVGLALQVPVLPGNSPTDLMDVAHMVIAVNLSWIALRAWNWKDATARETARIRCVGPERGFRLDAGADVGCGTGVGTGRPADDHQPIAPPGATEKDRTRGRCSCAADPAQEHGHPKAKRLPKAPGGAACRL